MKNRLVWISLICLMLTVLLLVSGVPEAKSSSPATGAGKWWDSLGEPKYGGTIVARTFWLNSTFDMFYLRPGDTLAWFDSMFAPDWTVDLETWPFSADFVPMKFNQGVLAESWEIPDARTMVIHIHHGVHWQDKPPVNGREFTASDIENHYRRLLGKSPYTEGSPMAGTLLSLLDNVTATDKYTVTIEFKKPSILGVFQVMTASPTNCIVAPESIKEGNGKLTDWKKAVGTGAWMLTDFVADTAMTLKKNPNYWGHDERHPENQLPYADELKFLLIKDTATAMAAMRTGKIDIMGNIDWQQSDSLAATNPELQQFEFPNNGWGVHLRCDNKPFTDIRVRRALQMSLDREAIAKSYYGGKVDATPCGIVSPAFSGYYFPYDKWPETLKEDFRYNPARAKELLAEAAADGVFEPNKDGGFDTNCVASAVMDLNLLQIIKAYYKDIGVDMEIKTMDSPPTFSAYVQAGKNDQMVEFYSAVAWSPVMLNGIFHSKNKITNYTHNNDPAMDALVAKFGDALSDEEAGKAMQEIDKYSLEKHWAIYALPTVIYNVCQPYLKGYSGQFYNWYHWFYFTRLWVDQD